MNPSAMGPEANQWHNKLLLFQTKAVAGRTLPDIAGWDMIWHEAYEDRSGYVPRRYEPPDTGSCLRKAGQQGSELRKYLLERITDGTRSRTK